MRRKQILVTGGAGFIGSHLADELIKKHSVTVLDDLSVGKKSNLKDFINQGGELIVGDIRDENTVSAALRGADTVFHLAVQCVRLSFSNPYLVHEVNTRGTLTLLEAVRKAHIRRFVYISSSEIYGAISKVPISENDTPRPTTIYGASKLAGEYYTFAYARSFGLPMVVVRPFNTYGPRSHFAGVYGEVIPKYFIRLLNDKAPLIFGDGKQSRDFTYISDTVKGIIKAGFSNRTVQQIINIGSGKEVKIKELARYIAQVCRKDLAPKYRPARPADVRQLRADIGKAQRLLNFKPEIDLPSGLKRYLKWLEEINFNFIEALKYDVEENWK